MVFLQFVSGQGEGVAEIREGSLRKRFMTHHLAAWSKTSSSLTVPKQFPLLNADKFQNGHLRPRPWEDASSIFEIANSQTTNEYTQGLGDDFITRFVVLLIYFHAMFFDEGLQKLIH